MKLKKGDNIKVRDGKDRGKTGKIIQVAPETSRIVVEGINMRFKHKKASKQGEKGQRIEFPAAMGASRVMLVCPKCGKTTRVGYSISADGTKSRVCKHCKELI